MTTLYRTHIEESLRRCWKTKENYITTCCDSALDVHSVGIMLEYMLHYRLSVQRKTEKGELERQRACNVILRRVRETIRCRGKVISITHSQCVSVALRIQHAKRTCRIILSRGVSGSTIFFFFLHYLINGTIFGKIVIEHKMCVLIFSTTFLRNIFHCKTNSVRYYHKCEDVLMKLELSGHIFEMSSNIKFCENPSGGSRGVPCGRTDMTKLIVAFRNFANAFKNEQVK
jgi:hypothetical protein